jgi:hypothetical protein
LKAAEESEGLTLAEDRRNVPRVLGATELKWRGQVDGQDLTEEAQHGRERLALRAGGDVLDCGDACEERLDLDDAEFGRGAAGVESQETANPVGICVDSTWGASPEGETLAENGEEVGRSVGSCSGGHYRSVDGLPSVWHQRRA